MNSQTNRGVRYVPLSLGPSDETKYEDKERFDIPSAFKKYAFSFKFLLLITSLLFTDWVLGFVLPNDTLPHAVAGPLALTLNGSYAGIHLDTFEQDVFLGMPFAAPPLGPLRFRHPQPFTESWDGVRNASAYSPQCPGYGVYQSIFAENWLSFTDTS